MKMDSFYIHADDIGVSVHATNTILQHIDRGQLSSVSLMPNFPGSEFAASELRDRPHVKVSIHLNLLEGKSCLPASEIPDLVDRFGFFKHSFGTLLLKYYTGSLRYRNNFRTQVHAELTSQVNNVKRMMGENYRVRLDSHQHIHVIPYIFNEVVNIALRENAEYIRIPIERIPFTLPRLPFSLPINLVKVAVINFFMKFNHKLLRCSEVGHNKFFWGITDSGRMNAARALSFVKKLPKDTGKAEILFHPGFVLKNEISENNLRFTEFYCSSARITESEELVKFALQIEDYLKNK